VVVINQVNTERQHMYQAFTKRRGLATMGIFAASALVLAGCASETESESTDTDSGSSSGVVELNLATVNNPQMVDMESLKGEFEAAYPDIKVNFIVMEEGDLRDSVTKDIASGGGQYDILTIGAYEVPIWGANGWLADLTDLAGDDAEYDVDDILAPVRVGLSANDRLYAVPFYGESSFLMYNKEIFEAAGLEMPLRPTWDEVAGLAADIKNGGFAESGICLRGKPGWGDQFAPLTTVVQTFGGNWFDADWNQTVNAPEFVEAVEFYTSLVRDYGQADPVSSSFPECLSNVKNGTSAMWYDATSAAGSLEAADSPVAGKMGYVHAPVKETTQSGWLWSWNLAIPASSEKLDAAWTFVRWATSKEYLELVGNEIGWANVPPGSRVSTYENPNYQEAAAAFADITVEIMNDVNPGQPGVNPQPWTGIQFVSIPEFQDIGNKLSQDLAPVFAGTADAQTVLDAAAAYVQAAGDAQK
jgi:sorbitol/mannitol transport system substrate-binding protein